MIIVKVTIVMIIIKLMLPEAKKFKYYWRKVELLRSCEILYKELYGKLITIVVRWVLWAFWFESLRQKHFSHTSCLVYWMIISWSMLVLFIDSLLRRLQPRVILYATETQHGPFLCNLCWWVICFGDDSHPVVCHLCYVRRSTVATIRVLVVHVNGSSCVCFQSTASTKTEERLRRSSVGATSTWTCGPLGPASETNLLWTCHATHRIVTGQDSDVYPGVQYTQNTGWKT